MSHYQGHELRKIKTFSRKRFIKLCSDALDEGFELHKASQKRDFPRFWRIKYKAQYRRYYVIDEARMAYISKKDLNYINTGIVK